MDRGVSPFWQIFNFYFLFFGRESKYILISLFRNYEIMNFEPESAELGPRTKGISSDLGYRSICCKTAYGTPFLSKKFQKIHVRLID